MNVTLTPQASPVAITDGFIQDSETDIVMQCHDRVFNDVDVRDDSDQLLFTVESKGMASFSWRRIVKDATGTPLFHFRKIFKYGVNRKWVVESPSGREVCYMRHVSFRHPQAVDVVVHNQADKEGNEALVQVRPKDQGGLTILVNIQDAPVAEIQMTEVNLSRNRDRSVWKARIAAGVDLTLVSTKFCYSEIITY